MTNIGHNGHSGWIRSALERFEGPLVRYAHRLTGDAERARDVVQETFLKLCHENPAEMDGHLAGWLFTVCRNKSLDIRRKERRMTTLVDANTIAGNGDETAGAADTRDEAGRALVLLEALPENQREVLRLKFQDNLTYRQIARITSRSVTNVGYLIHQGLKSIREEMNRSQ